MLPRWLEALLTPCPRSVRALGYLDESLAIADAYRRHGYAWVGHLKNTQAVIRSAMERCPQRRKAVLFGAGLLHDVPLDELTAAFREVVLVDIVHPRATRRRFRDAGNITLVSADITGVVDAVYRVAQDRAAPLPRGRPELFCADAEVDLVASINLLPQLSYLPTLYLLKAKKHGEREIAAFGRGVVKAHLDYLQRLPGTVALIADFAEVRFDRAGRVVDEGTTVCGVPLPWQGETWTWRLQPRRQERRVVGIADIKSAPP